ncbi:MAG: hypothetical protein R2780_03110 [Crocinitomicaceae bacterium]|nr:hypothetical protein [Crocinitomicaceae bacterium]
MNVSVKKINELLPKTLLVILLAALPFVGAAKAQDNIDVTAKEWTQFNVYGSVKVEYRIQECTSGRFVNSNMVFFRFSNLSSKNIAFKFRREVYHDGKCDNCHEIDSDEHLFEVKLAANEVIEADPATITNNAFYVFSNWARLVPGMTQVELNGIKLVGVESSILK